MDETLRCPTCNAAQPWSDICRRCRCDLALLHQTLRAARQWHRRALGHWACGDIPRALDAVQQSYALDPQPHAVQLWALCAADQGNWPLAQRLALQAMESCDADEPSANTSTLQ